MQNIKCSVVAFPVVLHEKWNSEFFVIENDTMSGLKRIISTCLFNEYFVSF